jgi:hypothetical protein
VELCRGSKKDENVDQLTPHEGNELSEIKSSLNTLFTATMWQRSPFARAIVIVLVIKAIGLFGMKILIFPDSTTPVVDASAMMRLIGPSTFPR